jgi:uncharacterized protein (TIGR02594 family)
MPGALKTPPWLEIAESMTGIREIPGPTSNPIILQWVKDLNGPTWFDNDDKAWCALFANKVCQSARLPLSGTGYALYRAKSFRTWGVGLATPSLGAVVVFKNPDHVGFYGGERQRDGALYVIGGNQRNAVEPVWIKKERVDCYRWPPGSTALRSGRVFLMDDGSPVSTSES